MQKSKYKNIYQLLELDKMEQAKNAFQVFPEEESVEFYLLKGTIEQRFQNWSKAINAYSKVLEIDPENQSAQNNLHVIQNILNFWNPEMFNP